MENRMIEMQGGCPARSLLEIEAEIMAQKRTIGRSIVVIGQALREAKGQLAYGAWGDWLREKVNFSQGTAENYMRIAEQVSADSVLLDLPYTKILALLAVPEDEREAFAEENRADEKSVSEIKRLIRERDDARAQIKTWMHSAEHNAHEATQANQRAERAEAQARAEARDQERLTKMLNQEREKVAQLMARDPDTVTIEREVPPADYEETKRENKRLNEALASTQAELEDMMDRIGDNPDPLDVVPFCDACAALLNALYAAPYAKAFFETRSDAELERYSHNINMIYKWALNTQVIVDGIRADRIPDDTAFPINL